MMTLDKQHENELIELCRHHNIVRLRVFGSVSRNEAKADSDLDLLVEFAEPKSLLTLVNIEQNLTDFFGRQVDLLTPAALSPYIQPQIEPDLQTIYEAK